MAKVKKDVKLDGATIFAGGTRALDWMWFQVGWMNYFKGSNEPSQDVGPTKKSLFDTGL